MKNFLHFIIVVFIASLSIVSCSDDPVLHRFQGNNVPESPDQQLTLQDTINILIDNFAIDVLENYYFWCDEPGMKDQIEKYLDPDTCIHPMQTIKLARHKEDRWTVLIDNMSELFESNQGIETSLGMEVFPFLIGRDDNTVILVVGAVYPNSPASDANLKRGDIFTKMNGNKINTSNYKEFYYNTSRIKLALARMNQNSFIEETGEEVVLVPIKMYEDPVVKTKVFENNGKKVGYMAYMSFTAELESIKQACQEFKEAGISELILDLRYNGGGMVSTLNAFASMLAPEEVVKNEEVFQTSQYNKLLGELITDVLELFEPEYLPYNIGLTKIYALVSQYSASASESLLVGLAPFMDIDIIGTQTHGKYCTGWYLTPENVYKESYFNKYKRYFDEWGIYVMVATFGDKDGYNGSRPDGFIPDYEIKDDPFDGYQLGDENETLLSVALERAGISKTEKAQTRSMEESSFKSIYVERPSYYIIDNKKFSKKLELNNRRF